MSKQRATIDQAKAAWESHPDPSIRKVLDALSESGFECSIATLQRWKKADWVLKGKSILAKKAAEKGKATVDAATAIDRQNDKTLTRLEMIGVEEAEMKVEAERLRAGTTSDSELARQATRESLIAQILLARQVQRRAAFLAEVAPDKVAKIIEALKGPAASTTIVIPPKPDEQPGQNGDGARVITGRLIEESPTQIAIASFKQRQKQGAAA